MSNDGYPRSIKTVAGLLAVCGLFLTIFYVTSAAPRLGIVMGTMQYIIGGAALLLPPAFLLLRANRATPKGKVPWYDVVAAGLSFVIPLYAFLVFQQARIESWSIFPPPPALVLGIIMCILIVEAGRRAAGTFFAITVLVMALAPLYVHLLPGFLQGSVFTVDRLIGMLFMDSLGMFGQLMSVFVLTFLLFIFFGVVLQSVGAGEFFTNVALSLLGEARGGAAKVAVIASALFGMVSGSATANVMVSGSFTIPMMKKSGFPAHFAAAVEAAASEGSAIMPPVMGAVAFIMANFLGIPYWRVALAAAVPAILYYWCLFSQVHFYSVNHGMAGVPRSHVPQLRKTLLQGWHIIVTALVLVWFLFFMKMAAGLAALWATAVLLALSTIRKSTRPNLGTMVNITHESARIFGLLAAILLAVGLIIGGMELSGIAMSFTQWLAGASKSTATGLIVLAGAGLVLGAGLPGAAVYVLLVILLGPGLEAMGLNRLAIHMTVLYWGILADFTPPTAVTPMVAAGFAGAPPMKTTLQTMRFGAVIYVAPIFFIFHPVILFENFELKSFILVIMSAFLGFWLLARGFEGYGPSSTLNMQIRRVLSFAAGVMTLTMVWYLQIAGVALAVGLYVLGRSKKSAGEKVLERAEQIE